MSTAFEHISAAAPVRHKRKGIPMRSPCQRDMVEAPGVVFRFPDKISSPEVKPVVTGLSILPSEAGLPSGHGDKSAAAVIAAAAAVSAADSLAQALPSSLLPSSTIIPAATASTPSTTITAASWPTKATTTTTIETSKTGPSEAASGADSTATIADPSLHAPAAASVPLYAAAAETASNEEIISSVSSTPILKPTAASSLPIHRSASNVLHYPELLSDLRDKLIQVHQGVYAGANNTSSGVESDENHGSAQPIKRARIKRASRSAVAASGSRSSPSPSQGPVGGRGSSVLRSTLRSRHELGAAAAAAAAASATSSATATSSGAGAGTVAAGSSAGKGAFHRRHSIGTIQSQAEDAEDSDIVVDGDEESDGASAATTPAPQQHKQQRNLQQHQRQRGQVGAAAKHYMPEGSNKGRRVSAEADAGTPGPNKRKRDAKEAVGEQRRGSSPAVKRPALHHGSRFSPVPSSAAAGAKAAVVTSGSVGSPFVSAGQGRRCCASCGASSTPCWRPGLIDSMTLCNQCGLRYKKGKVYCAKCSYVPTKTEIATGGANVCKRCTAPIRAHASSSSSTIAAAVPSTGSSSRAKQTEHAEPRPILPGSQHHNHHHNHNFQYHSSSDPSKHFGF
ncbi:DNA-binding transcription repressor [Coemansia erecta]|uniref:DNA-binding transcription repressor n=1 Tax=Coemansia asiatica TaxID=1052880 RepID=A0A9W7XI17_9FUNG|nr:DNA-binding transcription repressor [Coemansia asiatica]KAJ2854089.1 DNA-binding transcription repressor [Coemansia erecta]KAJ2877405.1 DNA-binding transcription repressor [Coemansia asiatica]